VTGVSEAKKAYRILTGKYESVDSDHREGGRRILIRILRTLICEYGRWSWNWNWFRNIFYVVSGVDP
jgi:hypothetical protein